MNFELWIKIGVLILLVLFFIFRSRFTSHYKKFTYRTWIKYPIIGGVLVLYLFDFLKFGNFYLNHFVRLFVGFPLLLGGMILFFWAHYHLGNNWSPIIEKKFTKSRALIKTGPYRFIRHPIYSASFIVLLGLGIITSNWLFAGAFFVILFLFYLYKISKEEDELIRNFGEDYKQYMIETWRLFPRLYLFSKR